MIFKMSFFFSFFFPAYFSILVHKVKYQTWWKSTLKMANNELVQKQNAYV